jgi:hypothetical protein
MEANVMRDISGDFGLPGGLTGVRRAWIIHATVYLSVNLGVATLALLHGRMPMLALPLGWGIGLVVHGAVALARGGRQRGSKEHRIQ